MGQYRIKCTHEIKGHSKDILALNFTNTDDRWIVTCGKDCQARVWDTKSGKLVVELEKHSDFVNNAMFTSDDCHIISVSSDKHIIVSEIIQEDVAMNGNGNAGGSFGTKYKFKTLVKIETKNYRDIELGNNTLVAMGNLPLI
ncbi:MAG: WD40 repeat domain-containing protein [Candidatus Roizmanbacteria bacterium]